MKYKSIQIIMIFCLMFFVSVDLKASQEKELVSINEEIIIKKVIIEEYIAGIIKRDFDLIRKICIPEVRLMNARRGKIYITSLEKWSKRFDPNNPQLRDCEAQILKIDREGTAAQVKILFKVSSESHFKH